MKNIYLCYQCRECASRCPVAFWFDVPPPRLLQYLQRGETDAVLKSRTPWLCASCETCATQCPHRLDLARVMADLTTAARDYGISPRVADVPQVFLPDVDVRQRATELGLIPSKNKRVERLLFEAQWSWNQLRTRTRDLLHRHIRLVAATRPAPRFGELLSAIAFVVLAPPMAAGLVAGIALGRVATRPRQSLWPRPAKYEQ